jgi:hypothetical protein
MTEKKRSVGVTVFGIIGLLLSLFHLIFVGLSLRLLIESVQLKFLLIRFLPTAVAGFFLGICAIFVLRLRNWARIMYLISIPVIVLIAYWSCRFLNIMGYFVYDWTLAYKLWKFSGSALILLGTINIFHFLAALVFFTRPKVKEQFR